MKEEKARALFLLAGFEVENVFELANGYWPEAYTELRAGNPWWLVKTEFGLIKIGWRKRVISIDWSDTDYRSQITGDDPWPSSVTKDDATRTETIVHAWTYGKAVEYLTKLHEEMKNNG